MKLFFKWGSYRYIKQKFYVLLFKRQEVKKEKQSQKLSW